MDDDLVFRALSDPSRRLLLDRLFERDGRTLQELQSQLAMTRFGVMKHLRVLEEAGLIVTRRSGREKLHYLNPVPIRLLHDRWISKYRQQHTSVLVDLKSELEGMVMTAGTAQVYQLFIKASPEQIWDGITKSEFRRKYFHGGTVESTFELGAPIRTWSGDHSTLWGDDIVLESEPPRRLVHTWKHLYDPELAAEAESRVSWEIEPQEGGYCKLTLVHDRLEGAPKTAARVSGGWMRILSGLKTVLETGEPLATVLTRD